MQKIIEFPEMASSGHCAAPSGQPAGSAAGLPSAPPSIEPIWTVVDSLARTLECIKTMCATVPNGPVREKLETERANLVIGLFVARVAAMRVSSIEPAPEVSADSNLSLVRRG
jgi:hypothetical protein